ncbi:GNAT family N-acetyltransferase [Actinoplanes sp. CA-142083]|uniref:GNAT family N-acetyltransferase n=1 Tax=Actinoplanes sp. CA-142083 TaxID=3239903 RepID=UPI003D946CB3
MTVQIKALVDPARAPSSRRLVWLATGPDDRPLGTAFLRIPADGGTADLRLTVHPAERRAGVGTRLLAAALAATSGAVLTEPVEEDSPGDHFCAARGLRPVLRLTYTRLALDAPVAAEPVSGYRLIHWVGATPPELVETFVRARHAMDDMPMDDADYVPDVWDADRLQFVTQAVADRGEFLCITAALTTEGDMASFTELVVPADGAGDAQHYGTGVLPEHRGRGLARWMKAEQIGWVRTRFPALTGLLADTADSNTAMRRVNESLGYRPTHRSILYQHNG